jgi:hypothetical protein
MSQTQLRIFGSRRNIWTFPRDSKDARNQLSRGSVIVKDKVIIIATYDRLRNGFWTSGNSVKRDESQGEKREFCGLVCGLRPADRASGRCCSKQRRLTFILVLANQTFLQQESLYEVFSSLFLFALKP